MIDDDLCDKEDRKVRDELREIGFRVRSVYDFLDWEKSYKKAIPLLVGLLPKIREDRIRCGIVKALTDQDARGMAEPTLIHEFRKHVDTETGCNWAIGNALSLLINDATYFDEIAELAQDKRYGRSREMLMDALAKTKDPRAVGILVKLLKDDDVAGHAVSALGRLHPPKARRHVLPFLEHEQRWVRRSAASAIRRIDEAVEKDKQRKRIGKKAATKKKAAAKKKTAATKKTTGKTKARKPKATARKKPKKKK